MISKPELIHYVCIAKSTTILAHHLHNPDDESLASIASKCIAIAPPNHSLFSQTLHNRTYTFLFDPPFLFFAIFDRHLRKSHSITFLHRLRAFFRRADHRDFSPFSFQPQFDSVFRDALGCETKPVKDPSPPPMLNGPGQAQAQAQQHGLKKKKREGKDVALLDLSDDVVLKQHGHDRQKAKHIWKKHVWVVLLLDLFVCAVLFVIWLWVCSGFRCMAY